MLGETYAPVTLEGRLVSTRDGQTVWRRTVFVRSNQEELDGLGKKLKHDKSRRLQASLHKAERKLPGQFHGCVRKEMAPLAR